MAANKTKKSKASTKSIAQKNPPIQLSENVQSFIFIALIAVILIYLLKPMVLDGLSPQGVDVIGSIGKTHKVVEWENETGERALWNPNVFSGMPRYQRSSPVVFSVDTLLNWLGSSLNNVFIYYLFGASGLFLLLRFMGMPVFISFFGAIIFVLMPHYKSLFLEGHFAKFRALMVLPWIVYTFKFFLDKRTLLSAALFALFFGVQIRTQHYQIVFYTGLLIFAIGVQPLLKDLFDKAYKRFVKSTFLIIAAVFLAVLSAAQPLFLANEYLPWSKRGKTTIDISAPEKTKNIPSTDGVSMEYATGWSTAPREIITWIVPRYFGGMSREKYTGGSIAQLKGKEVPGYWGEMPFTQSYEYMGALTLLLAIIGILYYRKKTFVISMAIFTVFLIFLSFGRHVEWFYSIFFNYVPYFNKFRAPMMSVTITFFVVSVFAALGLNALKSKIPQSLDFRENKPLYITLASFIGIGILIWLAGQGLSFIKSGETYDANTIQLLQSIRREMLNSDMMRYMALVTASSITIILYITKKLSFLPLSIFIVALSLIDLINIQGKVEKQFVDRNRLELSYFRETQTDRSLLNDASLYRVYPMGNNYGNNRFSYFHQSIGGYTPIKMFTMEEFVTNNLSDGTNPNRNIMKILNVKYLITNRPYNTGDLTLINEDANQQLYTYKYKDFKDRGYFVGNYKNISDEYIRLKEINHPEFNPDDTAITEEDLQGEIYLPDSSWVKVTSFNPNQTHFEVFTDKQSLFVISEMYYPPGWKILIDGIQVEKIYKTNHAVQSIIIPPGMHKIEVNFNPESYARNVRYAAGSLTLIFIVILSSVVKQFLDNRKKAE